MDIQKTWKETYRIGAYDTDIHGKVKLSKLTGYLQEAAWWHASYLGFGEAFIHHKGLVWVLSAIKIHMEQRPFWTDKITIETWPKSIERLFYLRDMAIYNDNEEIIGWATTQWLIVDLKTKRPKVVETDLLKQVMDPQKSVFEEGISKLPKVTNGKSYSKQIDIMDFDLNGHLNSNRYVELVLGTFDKNYYLKNEVVDFQLNFIKEVNQTQELILKKQEIQDSIFLIEGSSNDGKIVYFQSFVSLSKIDI